MTITPVNSIKIPNKYIEACEGWHNSGADLIYAICSTGGLTTGTNRPLDCDTYEKWYLTLWRNLSVDVMHARKAAADADIGEGGEDHFILYEFEGWIDATCEQLEKEYGLEDWEQAI